MENLNKDKLKTVVEELAHLRVDNCMMTHELIKREKNSIMPLAPQLLCDCPYWRGSLCDKKKRSHLGCAHTGYRVMAKNMISGLAREVPVVEEIAEKYINDLNIIEWDIIQIDNKRQDAELAHAHISKKICETPADDKKQKSNLTEQLNNAAKDVDDLIQNHNSQNDKLRKLQKSVANNISQIIY